VTTQSKTLLVWVCTFLTFSSVPGWAQNFSMDGDQVPDYWETRYQLNTTANDGGADPDGDGASNMQEFLAGTDPTNSLSFLELEISLTSAVPEVEIVSASNRVYRVQYTEDLFSGSWIPLGPNVLGTGTDLIIPNTNQLSHPLFRVFVGLPALFVQPDALTYGLADVMTTSLVQQIYVSNEDVTDHELTSVELSGSSRMEYRLSGLPPPNTVLSPGQTLQFELAFAPTGSGFRYSTVLCNFDSFSGQSGASLSGVGAYNYLVNAGGSIYTDSQGRVWGPELPYGNVGNAYSNDIPIGGTDSDMQPIYQTERFADTNFPADMTYTFPVEPGPYEVRLHFAEIFEGAQTLGSRIFDVYINDEKVLNHYDIVTDVGYAQAVVKQFHTQITNNQLAIRFSSVVNAPKISAIEIHSGRMFCDNFNSQWGYVPVGQAGPMQTIVLQNVGSQPMTIQSLVFQVLEGTGRDFTVTIDGINYSGGDTNVTIPVNITVPGGQSKAIQVQFTPSVISDNRVELQITGDFPMRTVLLSANGESSGLTGTLHAVISAPSLVVDYDQNGAELVTLDGSRSHTHLAGNSITRYEWTMDENLLGTNVVLSSSFTAGPHEISLTVYDSQEPPQSASSTQSLLIASSTNIPGSLVLYYPGMAADGAGSAAYYIDQVPSNAAFGEIIQGVVVTGGTLIGSSPYSTNVMVSLQTQVMIPASNYYAFHLQGGSINKLWVNGIPYTIPVFLNPGLTSFQANFAVDSTAQLPLMLLASTNGETYAVVSNSLVSYDGLRITPIINQISSEGEGNPVRINGLGFFPADSVVVHWGGTNFSGSQLSVTPQAIMLTPPQSDSSVEVTVETPNGLSNPFEYLNAPTGPASVLFSVTPVVTNLIFPTQGAWGPDGRFYVGSTYGIILALTFDDQYQVMDTQVISVFTNYANQHIMGIGFNPREAGGPVRLYVAHSMLNAHEGTCFTGPADYVGAVSVLTGPNFDAVETVIDGLPVSNYSHGINGLQFDDEGNLYIAVGGNSNAGVTNCAMGGLPESPLSGAILKAPISQPGFDEHITYVETLTGATNMNQVYGNDVDVALGTDVTVYAAGFRNAFDLVFTTAGRLYATDQGPRSGLGAASTSAATEGPDPEQRDTLNLVEEGQYYGHPNRNRGRYDARQNVYQDNNQPSVPGEFMQGMGPFPYSIYGLDEYRAETFDGALRGDLILQQWNGVTFAVKLTTNGQDIVSAEPILMSGLGLDVAAGPGGALIGMDHSGNLVVVATPQDESTTGMKAYDIFPWRAPATGPISFVIGGTGFSTLENTSVTIGGATATVTSVSPNRIRGILPNSASPTSALLDVVVQSGGETSVLTDAFRYLNETGP
jgi:glucose/arabinose dehydrogenase